MFAKRMLQKVKNPLSPRQEQRTVKDGSVFDNDFDPRVVLHYGIPSTASVLAFDPIQRLLAIGTLDGRMKVFGGDGIEALLVSTKQLPYKNLEFLQNQGFLVSISSENDVQVWDLEHRCLACSLHWESNITAFSVIHGTSLMYIGDEYGLMSVLKYNSEERNLLQLPYHIPAKKLSDAAGISVTNHQSVVGVLPQPGTSGNRILIAYENGLIILWDVSEVQVVLIRGYKDLQLKDDGTIQSVSEEPDGMLEQEQEEKEISSLCWASSSGSILAVGYIDGDIMLWNMSSPSTKNRQAGVSPPNTVVKLELSSAKRRLPVIVLHWSMSSTSHSDRNGQLFVYGGDAIGSEEVVTILSVEWSSGIETLRCVNRVDLTLNGSFADMILIPDIGATENNSTENLFVLTNPGHLHVYDDAILSSMSTQQEKKPFVSPVQFPSVIPAVDPVMTMAKLSAIPNGGIFSKDLLEVAQVMRKTAKSSLLVSSKWHLTGGVLSQRSGSGDEGVERVYITGYQDGSVRMWDATNPILSLIFVLLGEVPNNEVIGASASVSALDFCSQTFSLAVGNQSGLVRIYKLSGTSSETTFRVVTETKSEIHSVQQQQGLQCIAVLSCLSSPISALQYNISGTKLAIGFDCGRVAVLDMSSLSVLFLSDCFSGSSSHVVSITWKANKHIDGLIGGQKHQGSTESLKCSADALFVLTRDSHVIVVDSETGSMMNSQPLHPKTKSTAISISIIECSNAVSGVSASEKVSENVTQENPGETSTSGGVESRENVPHVSSDTATPGDRSTGSFVLLCCEDSLRMYSLKSVVQGDNHSVHKVTLAKPCCWTAVFTQPDNKISRLMLLYQTGTIEIRSFPDLQVVGESSLMEVLRWSFKATMQRTTSSTNYGQIAVVNGCELAFVSLLACENEFRIPDSLPCLHDEVLAAAANAAIRFSSNQKKKQETGPGIIGGIIRGFKNNKAAHTADLTESLTNSSCVSHLEKIFTKAPFASVSETIADDEEVVLLNIDDIDIEGPIHVTATSTDKGKPDRKDKETEREKLFQGGSTDTKPRLRTPEEIMAKYRKAGDTSAVASQARDKLVQRQEKLERISQRTEELQNGAENFASMASELVKTMEGRRKWWNI